MRNLLKLTAVLMVLAFNQINAQDTYHYKKFGQEITWEFTDSLLIVTTNGVVKEQPVKLIDKNDKMSVYYNTEPYMGMVNKYTFVNMKKDKFVMMTSAVDDFTKEVTNFNLKVIKIK